jgi:nitrate reductase gamma subunit
MGFYILSYACAAVFLIAVGFRIIRQASLPVHVRWEVYPVQHETALKISYGGSYMEETNWWEKKHKRSLFNEFKYMTVEILFIRGLFKENKSLWMVSFPFHFGLYLMVATFFLLMLNAMLALFAPYSSFMKLLNSLIIIAGWSGMVLGNIGSIGILCRRFSDPELRDYSSFIDYFNIVFIFLFFLSALITSLIGDPFLEGAKAYTFGLLSGGNSLDGYVPGLSIAGTITIISASLLAAYIPLTHMSHMFMKYFLYHRVKWDDAPNLRGGQIEAAVMKNLNLKPTWKAGHIGADGKKSWLDIASKTPEEKS